MAYRRLLDAYYVREEPLPLDQRAVYRLVMAATPEQRQAVDDVLAEFFQRTEKGWRHKRCDTELASVSEKRQKASRSAVVRWERAKAQKRDANAPEIAADAGSAACEGNAPNPNPNPNPKRNTGSGPAQSAAPPPPNFDGRNEEVLNGKSVVPIAAEFELPEQWGIDAEALGWKPGEVLREAEKFRQYWTAGRGKGTRRSVKGWRQSWSTWLSKAAERQR